MKMLGGFLFFVGLSAMWFGASVLLYGAPDPAVGTSCKAICGFALLASSLLGPVAGQVVGGGLTLLAGLGLALVGRARYEG